MIGNSLRSDILPVVNIGGVAVHIPAELTWTHEHADPPTSVRERYHERESLEKFPAFVEELGRGAGIVAPSRKEGQDTQRPRKRAAARLRRP